jgi:hypothetical protein
MTRLRLALIASAVGYQVCRISFTEDCERIIVAGLLYKTVACEVAT